MQPESSRCEKSVCAMFLAAVRYSFKHDLYGNKLKKNTLKEKQNALFYCKIRENSLF